ncbi:MAG: molybdopterin-dependent oxidoreductase [Verrucomicrobiota bacterium]
MKRDGATSRNGLAPLSQVLKRGRAQAVCSLFSIGPDGWQDSIDMADAFHPQTLLTYGMNGGDLPAPFGGPLRIRVPRQLAYKSVKYINRITVTDSLKQFPPGGDYSWYAGI